MHQLPFPVEFRWLAKNDIGKVFPEGRFDKLDPTKPDQFHLILSVIKIGYHALGTSLPNGFQGGDHSFYLNEGKCFVDFPDFVELGSVNVFVREIVKQLSHRIDLKLLSQDGCPFGTDPRKKFYFLFQNACHTK